MSNLQFLDINAEFTYWKECIRDCNTEAIHCDNKCRAKSSVMRFNTSSEKLIYYYSCGLKCKIDTENAKKR